MKSLKFNLFVLAIVSLFFIGCDDPLCIKGEGPIVTETLNIGNTFSKIEMEGSFDVEINYGAAQEVIAEGNQNIIDQLNPSVVGDELIIELEKHCYLRYDLKIIITLPYLSKVTLDGSGDILINEFPNQGDLELNVIGSGDIQVKEFTGTENLTVKIDGSGDINIREDFPNLQALNIRISGSGDFTGFPLISEYCTVSIQGSGSASVYASQELNATIDGIGDIYYKGNPVVNQSINGSGDIINRN